jgi:hypothetical protein
VEQETIEEKREKLLEILARKDGLLGRTKTGDDLFETEEDRIEMERADHERWLFEKVDMRLSQLGIGGRHTGIKQRVIPPCLLKVATARTQPELKLWKEAYQGVDREYSLKLLVKEDPRAITGSSDFEEEIKLKRHKLNEAVYKTMTICLDKFGWTEKQAPVIYDIKQLSKNGVFMSLHEVERSLQRVLEYANNTEYLWCFKLLGALNCKVRRLLWPPSGLLLLHDVEDSCSSSASEDEEEKSAKMHIDESIGFSRFLNE